MHVEPLLCWRCLHGSSVRIKCSIVCTVVTFPHLQFGHSDGLLYFSILLLFCVAVFNKVRSITRNAICHCVKINARGHLTASCFGFNDILGKLENKTKRWKHGAWGLKSW